MEKQQMEADQIDLIELFFVLWHKLYIIIATAVAAVAATAAVTAFLITPLYSANSTLYVLTSTTSITSLADIQLGTQLTNDYAILIKSRPVIEGVIENLNLDIDYDEAAEMIAVENLTDSRVLKITVTNPNPQTAMDMANETAEVMAKRMAEVMSTDEPSIVERAVLPDKPVSPSMLRNCAIGGLLGIMLASGVIVLLYLMNDTIKSVDDVEKYLGITVLAAIPKKQGEVLHEKKNKRRKKARRK